MSYDYQKFWDVFGDASWYNPSQRHRFSLILSEVKKLFSKPEFSRRRVRLLDLGCGKGHLLVMIKQHFPELECAGMDISESAIGMLKETVPQVTWMAADIQQPLDPSRHGTFDLVICSEVIEHCEHVTPILENILRLTRPGGYILITLPGGSRYKIDEKLGHLRHYTLEAVEDLFAGKPVAVRKAYSWGFPFHNLMRWGAHILHGYVVADFLDKKYSFRQKFICEVLYWLMFLNVPGKGIQRVVIFQKKESEA